MYRTIIIAALCGVIVVGSVIGGSYMIATAIRQAGDRQVDAIQQAGYEQSRATEQAVERADQAAQPPSRAEEAAARAQAEYEQARAATRNVDLAPLSSYRR
jgi:hypothetical protein